MYNQFSLKCYYNQQIHRSSPELSTPLSTTCNQSVLTSVGRFGSAHSFVSFSSVFWPSHKIKKKATLCTHEAIRVISNQKTDLEVGSHRTLNSDLKKNMISSYIFALHSLEAAKKLETEEAYLISVAVVVLRCYRYLTEIKCIIVETCFCMLFMMPLFCIRRTIDNRCYHNEIWTPLKSSNIFFVVT